MHLAINCTCQWAKIETNLSMGLFIMMKTRLKLYLYSCACLNIQNLNKEGKQNTPDVNQVFYTVIC